MKVLLSIKPEFAKKIFDGSKRYEYRRSLFANPEVQTIVVYASSPIKKVIGEFEIDSILNLEIETLWRKTKKHSGISKSFFFKYFQNKNNGFAIKIKNAKKYEKALCLKKDLQKSPPQSFLYLSEDFKRCKAG